MDGKGHARIARAILAVDAVGGLFLAVGDHPWSGVGLFLGGVGGLLITPDADHHVKTQEEIRWEGVPVVGPYALEVWAGYGAKNAHRGRSHWHVWGTVTRMWYFARRFLADFLLLTYVVGVVVMGGVMDRTLVTDLVPYLPGGGFFGFLFLGWCLQDSVHIETDRTWSWWKSRKGKRLRRRVSWGLFWVGLLGVVVYAIKFM